MKLPEASIRVHVDPTNPGQFFACCGLLELADRLWPGAEGWFEKGTFCVNCQGSLHDLLILMVMDAPEALSKEGNIEIPPLIAPLRFTFDGGATNDFVLDAWIVLRSERGKVIAVGNAPWNFWSGQQTSHGIWCVLRDGLAEHLRRFDANESERIFFHKTLLTGRFGFDPGAAWNALDVGFSPNEQQMAVSSSAAVELLAAVGIQRFRPQMAKDRQSFIYSTWHLPLTPALAAVCAAGVEVARKCQKFKCVVVSRGSYAALSQSFPFQGDANESSAEL